MRQMGVFAHGFGSEGIRCVRWAFSRTDLLLAGADGGGLISRRSLRGALRRALLAPAEDKSWLPGMGSSGSGSIRLSPVFFLEDNGLLVILLYYIIFLV